jgi:anti-sigma factor RsiW
MLMTPVQPILEEELHAFIDGELPTDRAAVVAAALKADPILAARVAVFAGDKAALAAAFRPIGQQPVPASWIGLIERAAATAPTARRRVPPWTRWAVGVAACVALALGSVVLLEQRGPPEGSILAQAEAARQERTPVVVRLAGAALADVASRDAELTHAVGLKLRAPDLAHLGWILVEIDLYTEAAALRYRAQGDRSLTMFVRPSTGAPRFDLFETGAVRVCLWQDEVVGAVMMGEMSAGQMMRVAGAAYAALNL